MPTAVSPRPSPRPPSGPLARWLAHPWRAEIRLLHNASHTIAAHAPLLFGAGAVLAALAACYVLVAAVARAHWVRHARWIAIAPPDRPDPAGGAAAWRMLHRLLAARRSLVGRRPPLAFEYRADPGGMRLGIWAAPTILIAGIVQAIEAAWPGAHAAPAPPPKPPTGRHSSGRRASLAAADWFPLAVPGPGELDPLRGLLAPLTGLLPGEHAVIQILARPAAGRRITRARRAARQIRRTTHAPKPGLGRVAAAVHPTPTSHGAGTDPLALADTREVTGKLADPPHFQVAVRYAITTRTRNSARRRAVLDEIGAGLGLYTGRNHLTARHLPLARGAVARRRLRGGFLASTSELAALAHLPADPARHGLPAAPARTTPPPTEAARA